MYKPREVSLKKWSRQSGYKCCWKIRLQNIMSDPRRHHLLLPLCTTVSDLSLGQGSQGHYLASFSANFSTDQDEIGY